MSPDEDNAFFADGVQEDILTNPLQDPGPARPFSRSSTLQYRNPERNLKQIGSELGGPLHFGRLGAACGRPGPSDRSAH